MKLFDVYPVYPIEPVKALDYTVWDSNGIEYLDLYGGHAVISIGHSHPHYVKSISEQLAKIGFYSNSIVNKLQEKVAERIALVSGYTDYTLFMCSSGAEANENALKLASFHTGRKKILAFDNAFHGRTSATVEATDNQSIKAPINQNNLVEFVTLEDIEGVRKKLSSKEFACVIIEGIQGVGGLDMPSAHFLKALRTNCDDTGTILILDEIQSGYGRTGKFFAHQHSGVQADIISLAKGMGNGFPVGGILISPKFKASYGLLGTTFGGNHLACAACLSVLDILEKENLLENAHNVGLYFKAEAEKRKLTCKGLGLMIGLELPYPIAELRKKMILEKHVFTGAASNKNLIRILPPLTIGKEQVDIFFKAFDDLTEANK